MAGEPYASEEAITLPVPADLAAGMAAEIYLQPAKRSVMLLRLGVVDIGHFRLLSLVTDRTPGGTPRLVATLQRMYV